MTDLERYDGIMNGSPANIAPKISLNEMHMKYWHLFSYYLDKGFSHRESNVVMRIVALEMIDILIQSGVDLGGARSIFISRNTKRASAWKEVGARGASIEIHAKLARLRNNQLGTDMDTVKDLLNYLVIFIMSIDNGLIDVGGLPIDFLGENGYSMMRQDKVARYYDSIRNCSRSFPVSLQIGLTDYCFNKCIMCGHWKREEKYTINLSRLLSFLEYGHLNGLESVCYSGGDPFCYGDINAIMDWHVSKGISFGFISAGIVPDKIDMKLLSKCSWVRASIDSVSEINYSVIRGGVRFSDVRRGVVRMKDSYVNVGIGMTLHKRNWREVCDVCDFAISQNIGEVRCWPVRHFTENVDDKASLLRLLYENMLKLNLMKISNNFELAMTSVASGEVSNLVAGDRCWVSSIHSFVEPDGNIYPCCILAGDTDSIHNSFPIGHIDAPNLLKYAICGVEVTEFCVKQCIPRLYCANHSLGHIVNSQVFI